MFETVTEEVRLVSEFLRNRNTLASFNGTWMVVAEWRDVPANGLVPSEVSIKTCYVRVQNLVALIFVFLIKYSACKSETVIVTSVL